MDFAVAPEITEALRRRVEHPVYGYPLRTEGYLRSVIEWMRSRHRWETETDWIVHTPGVVSAVNTAVLAYTEPGDGFVVHTPGYYPFFHAGHGNWR
jgi:cystathionine beta-lyase